MRAGPGGRAHPVLAYIAAHPGCSKAEAGRGLVEELIRSGYVRDEQPGPSTDGQLYLTEPGRQAAAGPARAGGARAAAGTAESPSGLAREFGAQACELLLDSGRVTVRGRAYLVVIPDDRSPSDPVYLRRDDGRMFAVRLEARVLEVGGPGMEAAL
jgi:hypothetical protein